MTAARRLVLPLVAAVLTACSGTPAPPPTPSPSPSPTTAAAADPDEEALAATVDELVATVAALRVALQDAADGDPGGLDRALVLLVAEPAVVLASPDDTTEDATDGGATEGELDGTSGDNASADDRPGDAIVPADGLAPVLPGPRTSREESIRYGDLLTRTMAAARSAGGAGEPALRFLADPLAGDLGAWQRAPGDQLTTISRAGTRPDLAATETAVLALAGEAPRALAWVVHGLTVPADGPDAAGRALAHLAVIDLALDQLT